MRRTGADGYVCSTGYFGFGHCRYGAVRSDLFVSGASKRRSYGDGYTKSRGAGRLSNHSCLHEILRRKAECTKSAGKGKALAGNCGECGKAVQTQPDSDRTPGYGFWAGGFLCDGV